MVNKTIAAFAFLAVILSITTPALSVKSTRSLLCPSCSDGCSTCVCGKCVKCGWGHHRSGLWSKDCVPDCKSCNVRHCDDCGCDGYCNACQRGYEFGEYGDCVKWVKPAPKPVHYKKGKGGGGGGGRATAKADAWGGSTKTKTSTNCDGYGCSASSRSRSRSG
ncbi:hypothetical protein BSKO_03267 [Bryopsis sp. KO-2023]|nr:hypothetical protein BSKO_03267 [Bryopsis sp. KO-2023]